MSGIQGILETRTPCPPSESPLGLQRRRSYTAQALHYLIRSHRSRPVQIPPFETRPPVRNLLLIKELPIPSCIAKGC